MAIATKKVSKIERIDEGDWLRSLLADVREAYAVKPTRPAVARMRARVLAQLDAPVAAKAA